MKEFNETYPIQFFAPHTYLGKLGSTQHLFQQKVSLGLGELFTHIFQRI